MKEILKGIINRYGRKNAAVILSVLLLTVTAIGYTTAYLIGKTDTLKNTFVSGVDPYGSLTISKIVEHPYGESYVVPEGLSFAFKVDLGNECANRTFSGYTADSNGVIELEIPYGAGVTSVTLAGVPADTHAVVTEQDIPSGFAPEGDNPVNVTVEKAKEAKAEFVNKYTPEPAVNKIKLGGIKTLEGREWRSTDKFDFTLEQKTDEGWSKIADASATESSRSFSLTSAIRDISFDHIGTYMFRVSEDEGSIGGIIYDTNISCFDVIVTDEDMDGRLEIKGVMSSSPNTTVTTDEETKAPVISMKFKNEYAPAGSAAVFFNIAKTMKDASGQAEREPSGYSFGLYDEDGELIAESDPTSAAGEVSIKRVFTPEDIGKYHWTLKEIEGTEPGIKYDDTEYEVEVNVVDNGDGTVSAYVYDYKAGQEVIPAGADNTYDAAFENTYDPDDAKVSITGDKKLKGRSLKKGEFSFDLYKTDSSYDITDKKPVMTVSNTDTDGTFSYGLTFDKVGTFYYVAKENSSEPLGGVTYDDAEYRIKAVVTDAGGRLEAEYTICNAAGEEAGIVFNNKYVPADARYSLRGTKTLKGRDLGDGMFSFALYESDSSFSKEEAAGEALNSKDGSFSFGEYVFDKEGKHYFIVKELSKDPVKGVTYDDTVYHVTVEVKDNGEGDLVTSEDIVAVSGTSESAADSVSFTNTYKGPEPAPDEDKDKKTPDDKSSKNKSAKTGDRSMLIAWIVMMILSAEGLVLVMLMSKRNAKKELK